MNPTDPFVYTVVRTTDAHLPTDVLFVVTRCIECAEECWISQDIRDLALTFNREAYGHCTRCKWPQNLVELARLYYRQPGNEAGGRLSYVLEDRRIEDDDIHFGLRLCSDLGDEFGGAILTSLRHMTLDQRQWVVDHVHEE